MTIPALDRLGAALRTAVVNEQATRSRRARQRRRWLAAAIASLAAVATITLGIGLPDPTGDPDGPRDQTAGGPLRVDAASAKVVVRKTSAAYEITLRNVLADPESVRAALRRHGLDVTIQFVPASPSLVGQEVFSSVGPTGQDRVRWRYEGRSSVDSDLVALTIPLDYEGRIELAIGRRARPGEDYAASAISVQLPGEPLHCANVEGQRVRDILPILDQRQLNAVWQVVDGGRSRLVTVDLVLDRYVNSATTPRPGWIQFEVTTEQPDHSRLDPDFLALMREGCPAG